MIVDLADKISRLRGGRSNAELANLCECSTANIQKIIREGSQPNYSGDLILSKMDMILIILILITN